MDPSHGQRVCAQLDEARARPRRVGFAGLPGCRGFRVFFWVCFGFRGGFSPRAPPLLAPDAAEAAPLSHHPTTTNNNESLEQTQIRARKTECDHETIVIPDSGHYTFLEAPAEFISAVRRACAPYLQKAGASGGAAYPPPRLSAEAAAHVVAEVGPHAAGGGGGGAAQ
jgi:hypothetical protein